MDEGLFRFQVFTNILTNSIKFLNEYGKIIVEYKDEKNYSVIEIHDNGIGIPKRILKNIFNPAQVTSRPGTQGEPGTGYGMPILKKVMEAHGAEVQVLSPPRQYFEIGTTVLLRFKK